jgi:hypothetical protein
VQCTFVLLHKISNNNLTFDLRKESPLNENFVKLMDFVELILIAGKLTIV